MQSTTPLSRLNGMDRDGFVAVCGPLFEHSPWIAERCWSRRPFVSRDALHQALCNTMYAASQDEQLRLIRAHPDLVGRLAREGRLTQQSAGEQAAAGLTQLTAGEISQFEQYNRQYHDKFGFPFVICARENRKQAILAAFPKRLGNGRQQEMQIALREIARIALLRLMDTIDED